MMVGDGENHLLPIRFQLGRGYLMLVSTNGAESTTNHQAIDQVLLHYISDEPPDLTSPSTFHKFLSTSTSVYRTIVRSHER